MVVVLSDSVDSAAAAVLVPVVPPVVRPVPVAPPVPAPQELELPALAPPVPVPLPHEPQPLALAPPVLLQVPPERLLPLCSLLHQAVVESEAPVHRRVRRSF